MDIESFTPTEFLSVLNQTLGHAYPAVTIVGEVASFKINQGKWVFFDIKDENTSVPCFMTLFQLRMPLEDGMKVMVKGVPKITKWGKFSFTVTAMHPVGEGSLKKAYELLKKKLASEGLFDDSRKRLLPKDLTKIGVISSTGAAGYADFVKILNERWGGIKVQLAHTQVQGMDAPDQIIRALRYFNEHGNVQVIAILRGGGSADDLSCFNDEKLVREIAVSKIPVVTGIGHEVDESLADLVADVRASTPSNVAEMLTPDKNSIRNSIDSSVMRLKGLILDKIDNCRSENTDKVLRIVREIRSKLDIMGGSIKQKIKVLEALNPESILKQGYAIISGKMSPGNVVKITTYKKELTAEIKEVNERK